MLTGTDTLHDTRNKTFLDNCYKAGQEWAEFAHGHGDHAPEDGLNEEFWSQDSYDYEAVSECAEQAGFNFRTEYQLRQAGLKYLYKGCIERWQTLSGKPRVKRFDKETVVKAAKSYEPVPVAPSEPHVVVAPQPVVTQAPVITKASSGPTIISGRKIVILQKGS